MKEEQFTSTLMQSGLLKLHALSGLLFKLTGGSPVGIRTIMPTPPGTC